MIKCIAESDQSSLIFKKNATSSQKYLIIYIILNDSDCLGGGDRHSSMHWSLEQHQQIATFVRLSVHVEMTEISRVSQLPFDQN